MGRVTSASISSGATFGQVVETAMIGKETLGSRSTGKRVSEHGPQQHQCGNAHGDGDWSVDGKFRDIHWPYTPLL